MSNQVLYVEKLSFYLRAHWYSVLWQAQNFEDPDVHHRHVSHLFGLFPGHTITLEKTPDLCKAADNTLYKRGLCEKALMSWNVYTRHGSGNFYDVHLTWVMSSYQLSLPT